MMQIWYAWILWILGAAGGIAALIRAIVWLRDRTLAIECEVKDSGYTPPKGIETHVKVFVDVYLEHKRGPKCHVARAYWRGIDDGLEVEFNVRERVGVSILQDGNFLEICLVFELDRGRVKIREDETIHGVVSIEGTRGYKTSFKCIARPYGT